MFESINSKQYLSKCLLNFSKLIAKLDLGYLKCNLNITNSSLSYKSSSILPILYI
jgi:hypothetical protein